MSDDSLLDEIIEDTFGTPEPGIFKKCNHFETLTSSKILNSSLSTEEIIEHRKFILIVDNLLCKFPFFARHKIRKKPAKQRLNENNSCNLVAKRQNFLLKNFCALFA